MNSVKLTTHQRRMVSPASPSSPNRYAATGNDPVNVGVGGIADTPADDWVFPGGTIPTQRQMYGSFLRAVNSGSVAGMQGLQTLASFNPAYIAGEGITGRDLYNRKVSAWQRAIDIAVTALPFCKAATVYIMEYGQWRKLEALIGQAHQIAQNKAFERFIPRNRGMSVNLVGNAFSEVGSPHWIAHTELEKFWSQFREGGALAGSAPTVGEYNAAAYSAFGSVLATSGQTTPFGWQGQSGAYTDSETAAIENPKE